MAAQQKALLLQSVKGAFVVKSVPKPKAGPGELLVKIEATALNPVDWKIQELGIFVNDFPATVGSDAAGVVESTGEGVTRFAAGDRVLFQGFFNNRLGTFQQYAPPPEIFAAKIPAKLTFDQAATIPLGLATASFGLYHKKFARGGANLTPAWEAGGRGKYAGNPILILGGSTSVGQYVIQLAKLSGFSPIMTTASPHNAELLKSLGATHVIDRHNVSSLANAVKEITPKPVEIIYDAVGEVQSQRAAYDLLAPGGTMSGVLPCMVEDTKRTPDKTYITVLGNVHYDDNKGIGQSLYSKLTELLEAGDIKPNRVEVVPGGLAGIVDGLDRLRHNKVSGFKLVVHPPETP